MAAAAYRLGVAMLDERTGVMHDYTHKGGIDGGVTLAPSDAPDWATDPARLWNEVERMEKRKDSQLAREFDISLLRELSPEQNRELALGFVTEEWVSKGMVATVAFHHLEGSNPHCHVMLTMRSVTAEGFGQKNRDWNAKELMERWREEWATHANKALDNAGSPERVDHRSLLDQQLTAVEAGDFAKAAELDREPTTKVGKVGTALAARGEISPLHAKRLEIQASNAQRQEALRDRFRELQQKAHEEGRMSPHDEQAMHAQALLERTTEGKERLATIPGEIRAEVSALDNLTEQRAKRRERKERPGAPPVAASGRPKAQSSTTHGVRSPRPPGPSVGSTRTRLTGDGTKQGDKLAKAGERWLRDLDEMVAQLIRTALEAARQHSAPLERMLGRELIHAGRVKRVREWQEKHAVHKHTKAQDSRVRRSQRRAGAEHDFENNRTDKLMMKLTGAEPKPLRDLREKEARAKAREAHAKKEREEASTAKKAALQDFEQKRQAFMAAWQKNQPVPHDFGGKPEPKPTPEATPTMPPAPWAAPPPSVEEQAKKPRPPRM